MAKVLNFKVIVQQDEDSLFVATVPAIPGCYTQAKTYEEAIKRIQEAIELCLEVSKDNSSYKEKIDLSQAEAATNRFLGIANIAVRTSL